MNGLNSLFASSSNNNGATSTSGGGAAGGPVQVSNVTSTPVVSPTQNTGNAPQPQQPTTVPITLDGDNSMAALFGQTPTPAPAPTAAPASTPASTTTADPNVIDADAVAAATLAASRPQASAFDVPMREVTQRLQRADLLDPGLRSAVQETFGLEAAQADAFNQALNTQMARMVTFGMSISRELINSNNEHQTTNATAQNAVTSLEAQVGNALANMPAPVVMMAKSFAVQAAATQPTLTQTQVVDMVKGMVQNMQQANHVTNNPPPEDFESLFSS